VERYKQMIARCLKEETAFGVVLIRDGAEVGGPAIPERVGTIARIHAVEPLDDGRLNLFTEGASRFRIQSVDSESEPYLMGMVETLSDEPNGASAVDTLAERTRELFGEYFDILLNYAGVDLPGYELPDCPEELSFVLAAVVQAEMTERQSFLEMTDTGERLRKLYALLTADISRLRLAADRSEANSSMAQRLPAEWRERFISRN
jgi:uncharacterized protein